MAEDYATAQKWLDEGEVTLSDETGSNKEKRIKAVFKHNGEEIHSVWEVRTGNRNPR